MSVDRSRSSSTKAAPTLLALCALRVFASHTLSALLTEHVFTKKGFVFPAIFGAVEFATFALAPVVLSFARGQLNQLLQFSFEDVKSFIFCGASMAASHGTGLAACTQINYTTTMLFGSAKLPSVLLAASAFSGCSGRPRPPITAQLAAFVVTCGLCCFGLAEHREAPRFSSLGLALVGTNLVLAAGTFQMQQQCLQESKTAARSIEQMMLIQYATGSLLLLLYALFSGELSTFLHWCCIEDRRGPFVELVPIFCGAVCTSIGVRALLRVSQAFDAARASTITSLRKVCSFGLSFFLFPKPFGSLHCLGTALVLMGSFGVHNQLSKVGSSKSGFVKAAPTVKFVPQQHDAISAVSKV